VDATCCRLMGLDPERVDYLRHSGALGTVEEARIEQRGESIASLRQNFAVIEQFKTLRAG